MNKKVEYHIEKSEAEDCYLLIYDETCSVDLKYLNSEFKIDIKKGQIGAKIEDLESVKDLKAFFSNASIYIYSNVRLLGEVALLYCPSFGQYDKVTIRDSVIVSGETRFSQITNSVLLNNDLLACDISSSTMEYCQCEDFVVTSSTVKRTDAEHGRIFDSNVDCCSVEDIHIFGADVDNSKVCAGSIKKSKIVAANVCRFLVSDSIIKNVRLLAGTMSNIPINMANIQNWFDFGCIGRYFFYKQIDNDAINHVVISEYAGTFREHSFDFKTKEPSKITRVSSVLKNDPTSVFVYENFGLIAKVNPSSFLNSLFDCSDEETKNKISIWFSAYFHFLTEYVLDVTSSYSVVAHLNKKQYVNNLVANQMGIDLKSKKLVPRPWSFMDEDTLSVIPDSIQKPINSFYAY